MAKNIPIEVLQAISDWQRGGSPEQKKRRGERLKKLVIALDSKFRRCGLCAFRQIALIKGDLWNLLAENLLPERISAWTTDLAVAKQFKGGVPPKGQGYQGVIFMLPPSEGNVILNMSTLFADSAFKTAIERHRRHISGFTDGLGKYGRTQSEVVIEIDSLDAAQVFAFGGFSSDRHELAALMLGRKPSEPESQLFDRAAFRADAKLGPAWIEGNSVTRVVARLEPHIQKLRQIKRVQEAAKSKN
jgi:hypothetical protein